MLLLLMLLLLLVRVWHSHAILTRRRREQLVVIFELDYYVDVEERESDGGHEYEHDVEHAHVDDVHFGHVEIALSRMGVVLDHGEEGHGYAQAEQPDEYDGSARFALVE